MAGTRTTRIEQVRVDAATFTDALRAAAAFIDPDKKSHRHRLNLRSVDGERGRPGHGRGRGRGMSAPQDVTAQEIDHRFTYHPPTGFVIRGAHDDIRSLMRETAHQLRIELPPGREKSLALTALEEASFWCHAAIARNHAHYQEASDE